VSSSRPVPPRASGVLLHVTSLPGGRFGAPARAFVDWLAAAGQSWWQVLPLGPPDPFGSPYSSPSAFAGWNGILADPDARVSTRAVDAFRTANPYWAPAWEEYAGPGALADQVRFVREWSALRAYARRRGVRIIGDLPIYVAAGSIDQLTHPELFRTGVVAGVPSGPTNDRGQRWGNPCYDWPAMRRSGYAWWIARMRHTAALYDLVRIDHFRGFVAGWEIPTTTRGVRGRWRPGPGKELFEVLTAELGPLAVIAEDLGIITPAVHRLRDACGFPGMVVVQWAFGGGARNPHALDRHPVNAVAYTGTHDTPTIAQWWKSIARPHERAAARAACDAIGITDTDRSWALVRLALASNARIAIIPAQDLLGLGASARMNRPGTHAGNWVWRLDDQALDDGLARRLHAATEHARRIAQY